MTIAQAMPEHFPQIIRMADFMLQFEKSDGPPPTDEQSEDQMLSMMQSAFPIKSPLVTVGEPSA